MCFVADGYCEFYRTEEPIARKKHRCEECRAVISPGERYFKESGLFEGDFFEGKKCARCRHDQFRIYVMERERGCDAGSSSTPPPWELLTCLINEGLQRSSPALVPSRSLRCLETAYMQLKAEANGGKVEV